MEGTILVMWACHCAPHLCAHCAPYICLLCPPFCALLLCPCHLVVTHHCHCVITGCCHLWASVCGAFMLFGWSASFVWAVVGIGHHVEVGVGLAVAHWAYNNERWLRSSFVVWLPHHPVATWHPVLVLMMKWGRQAVSTNYSPRSKCGVFVTAHLGS